MADAPTSKERALLKAVTAASAAVADALLRVENAKLLRDGRSRLDGSAKASVPYSGVDGLRLLTLRAWASRYHVSLDFILAFLLDGHFSKIRARPGGGHVSLGVSVAALTGVKARQALEEEIVRAYPMGENVMAARDQLVQIVRPPGALKRLPQSADMIAAYGQEMESRQRLRRTKFTSKRAWRGNPDPVSSPGEKSPDHQ